MMSPGADKAGTGSSAVIGAALVFITLLAAQPDASPLSRFTPEQRTRLEAGEVVFEYVLNQNDDQGLGHGEAYVVINRPARVCYDEMVKFDLKKEYFPRMAKSEIVKSENSQVWVHEVLEKRALMTSVVGSVDVGVPVPGFIMKALSSRDLPGIAANVKKRFESDGKWKKP